MKKIKQLSFVLFIFSVLAFSYPVTQVFAQGGGQCDSNPACDPTSGTCCNQCDPNPACVVGDPHAIPCCSSGSNNMSSGTLPPRIPAPSGHDKMNHENRRPSGKKHLPEGKELRDALKGCLNELELKDRQLQKRAQPSSCGRGVSQANRDQNTIRDLRSDLHTVCDNMVLFSLAGQEHAGRRGNVSLRANPVFRDTYGHMISICQQSGWSCPLGDSADWDTTRCSGGFATLQQQLDRVSDAIGPN